MADTKEQLTEAFWQLLEKKPYKKITVRDIVDFCQVNRNTFYYHFDGIPDLLHYAIRQWEADILSDERLSGTPLFGILPIAGACMSHKNAILHLRDSKAWQDVQETLHQICFRAAQEFVHTAEQRSAAPVPAYRGYPKTNSSSAQEPGRQGFPDPGGGTANTSGKRDCGNPTARTGSAISGEDRDILTRFYQSVLSGCLLDWINTGMNTDLTADIGRVLRILNDPAHPQFHL